MEEESLKNIKNVLKSIANKKNQIQTVIKKLPKKRRSNIKEEHY